MAYKSTNFISRYMSDVMEQAVTIDTAKELGLLPEEFQKIKEYLGRTPNFTELSIYSVMWSEHCSYKNSIVWLKTLPKDGPHMLVAAGEENAGLVGIGDGLACAFKIESHNHPSAIEPFQGAATGVGGINRDIFTMGARPIAQLNSLRFGNPLLETIVKKHFSTHCRHSKSISIITNSLYNTTHHPFCFFEEWISEPERI